MSNSQTATGASRHPKYYFLDTGCHIFLVENTLYRLSMDTLSHHSQVLADMFSAGKENLNEGESDNNPIQIPQLQASTFDLFVEHHVGFPRTGSTYTKEELEEFLEFCEKYECDATKQFVVDRIEASNWRFHPAELVSLATTYRLPTVFQTGFRRLTDLSLTHLTKHHRSLIGSDVFINLALAKAVLDRHRRIVAAEEPRIIAHADDCEDPMSCEADWHAVWWNGMGRYLLDGRNPQPYNDAVRRFKSEMQFGRVGQGCRKRMFKLIDGGVAFKHANSFLDELCDRLVRDLHIA